jgi:glycosyltransferase involved in cell wall biosynthesis
MKICLINNLYEPYVKGGAEKVAALIAEGLRAAGYEVFIITTKPSGGLRKSDCGNRIYYLNSLYYNLGKFSKWLRFFWHLWDMFNVINYFKVKNILKKEKCQAVITNNLMGIGFSVPLAIRRLKIKHLHLVHDLQLIHPSGLLCFGAENLIEKLAARNYASLVSWLFASPAVVIFPSRWLRDQHLDKIFFIKSKRIILPNPVAPAAVAAGAGQRQSAGAFKFLYLGQIEKHKGVGLLIQAFKMVKEKFGQAELLVAGAGSELAELKSQAEEGSGIKFLGWQNEKRMGELLASCHALVLPTLCYENCPTVILEAFSAGLPVLAADLGGISELVGGQAGVLFKPGDVLDLAEKMVWLVENRNNLAEMIKAGEEKAARCGVENYVRELGGLMR